MDHKTAFLNHNLIPLSDVTIGFIFFHHFPSFHGVFFPLLSAVCFTAAGIVTPKLLTAPNCEADVKIGHLPASVLANTNKSTPIGAGIINVSK